MILVFGNNSHWISKTIRVRTGSIWSHCGILDDRDPENLRVIEAMGGNGVHSIPLEEFQLRYRQITFRFVAGSIEKAESLVGQPFDLHGLRGIFFRTFTHAPDAWFCSELVAYAMSHVPDEFANFYTPGAIFRLSFPLLMRDYKDLVDYIEKRNGNKVNFKRRDPFALDGNIW